MADPRFFDKTGPVTLGALAELTGARLSDASDASVEVDETAPLELAGPSCISYVESRKHAAGLETTQARACFAPEDLGLDARDGLSLLFHAEPKIAYAKAAAHLYRERAPFDGGESLISPAAFVEPSAEIGVGTRIAPGAVIGAGVVIGAQCHIGPNVTVQHAVIGDRVHIHPGVTIGQDGFGFAFSGGVHHKVPQVGRVVIENDVEIGANTTIDRGAAGDTFVGAGTKIDNLVQIGHNCRIGQGCVIVAQAGLAGSTILEDYVVLGGQVGTAGHLTIGKGAQVAAQSGVPRSIPAGAIYGGYPAKPIVEWRREAAILSRMVKARKGNTPKD